MSSLPRVDTDVSGPLSRRQVFVFSGECSVVNGAVSRVFFLLAVSGVVLALLVGAGLAASHGGVVVADENSENTTDRHVNPEEYGEDGDGAESWLENHLSDQLGDSMASISEDEYDMARDLLGEDYDSRLGDYIEVAGDTDDDEESAQDSYEEAAEKQERLADLYEQYDELLEEYEAALDDGDEELALEIARELEDVATEIESLSDELIDVHDDSRSRQESTSRSFVR